ncbi:MAG: GGDEF domain-containing protein [Planctomycetota bacterium]
MTRLYNRGVGIGTLEREIARARRQRTPLTVLMMDLDDFKQLNDQHGHLAGDQALRITAEVLRKTLRKTDTVCRYGGEEFLMVLPDTTIEQASVLATRIFTAVEAAGKKHELPLTGSIGLTEIHYVKDSLTTVLARADRALYASKSRGRNRFSVDGA